MAGDPLRVPVVLLMGPTATGKTDVAIEVARHVPVEIISVDSALVYRGLDIGTGKPSRALREAVPHHLIDIREPNEVYSAGQFAQDAVRLIHDIHGRGRVPLLVGGTMLYFRALTRGIAELPSADPEVRRTIEAQSILDGWPALHRRLADIDPVAAARILPNDGQRIQRALEVWKISGRTLTDLQAATKRPDDRLEFTSIAWNIADRQTLYERIERRMQHMVQSGLVEEVRRLWLRGDLTSELPAIRAVGYRQLWRHLQEECSLDEAITQAIVATRHLARRQLIWLRADASVHWMDASSGDAVGRLSERVSALRR